MKVTPSDDYLKRRRDAFDPEIPLWLPFALMFVFLLVDLVQR